MHEVDDCGIRRTERRRWQGAGVAFFLLVVVLFAADGAFAHGVDYRIEHGEAVMVYFTSHHGDAMTGAGFRVFSPDGQQVFASGNTDVLGRAVFVPDQPGNWRVLMATEDGHGAEVQVVVDDEHAGTAVRRGPDAPDATTGRIPATAAGIGYLFGLAGLLVLWCLRR